LEDFKMDLNERTFFHQLTRELIAMLARLALLR
jgi:hypothetical protein